MRSLPWLLTSALLAACGSVNTKLPDGGADDAPDAGPDAEVVGTITVTVLTDYGDLDSAGSQLPIGIPRQGAQVLFIEASGDYTLVTTAGDGVAVSPPVHAGTSALIVRPRGVTEYGLEAYLALVPGTRITDGPRMETFVPTTTISPPMTVNTTPVPGATSYGLSLSCWNSYSTTGSTFSVTLIDPCDRTDRTMVVTAYDTNGLRSFSAIQTDMQPGGTVTMPAFQNAATFVLNASNIPSAVTQLYAYGNYLDGDGYVGYVNLSGTPSGGSAVMQALTTPAGNSLELHTEFTTADFTLQKNQLIRTIPGAPTTAAMNLAAVMPFTTAPVWDPTSREVTWTELGTANRADIVIGHGYYQVAAGNYNVQLTVIGPHVGTTFQLPPLPVEIAHLTPAASDTGYIYDLLLVDDTEVDGYLDLVEDAYADGRNAVYGQYGDSAETWISGGNNSD